MIQRGVWNETVGAKLKYWDKNPSQGHFADGGYHMDVAFFQVSLLIVGRRRRRRRHHHHHHHHRW